MALVCIWGSSFILMKKSLQIFDPVQLGFLRMSFASLILIPFIFRYYKKIPKDKWIFLFIAGLIGNSLPAYLFSKAQTGIDSSLAGVLNAVTPFFTLIVGLLFFKLKVRFINILGLLLGLIGAVEIIGLSGLGNFNKNLHYSGYIILATILYAINLNLIKEKLKEVDSFVIVVFSISMVGIPSMFLLFEFTPFMATLQKEGAVSHLIYPAVLGIGGSAIALMMYYHLVKITDVVFSSSVTYFLPIVAILFGVLDGEIFRMMNLVWIVLIIIGIYLVNRKPVVPNDK